MTDILPTHTCFDDVNGILLELAIRRHFETLKKLFVVHAVCTFPDGRPYSHAWIEVDDECLFCGIINGEKQTLSASPVKDYREHHKIRELKRYTLADIRKFGDVPPPYEEPFKSLCGNSGEVYRLKNPNEKG